MSIARVLIVDDDARVRDSIVRLLNAAVGEVTTRHTGTISGASELATTFRPHLAVVDVMLPDVRSGLAVMGELTGKHGITVIGMSVSGAMKTQALRAGAIAFFEKDSSPEHIIEVLGDALAGGLGEEGYG